MFIFNKKYIGCTLFLSIIFIPITSYFLFVYFHTPIKTNDTYVLVCKERNIKIAIKDWIKDMVGDGYTILIKDGRKIYMQKRIFEKCYIVKIPEDFKNEQAVRGTMY